MRDEPERPSCFTNCKLPVGSPLARRGYHQIFDRPGVREVGKER